MIQDLVTVAKNGGAAPLLTPGEAAEADRAMRRLLLGPLIGVGLGKEREILRSRMRTWDPWPAVLARELPEHTGLATLLDQQEWAIELPAIDGFWELWTRIDELERVVIDPEQKEWRLAFASFSQVLERQAERDTTVTLDAVFRLTDDEGIESIPLLPYRPDKQQVTLTTLHQAKGLRIRRRLHRRHRSRGCSPTFGGAAGCSGPNCSPRNAQRTPRPNISFRSRRRCVSPTQP